MDRKLNIRCVWILLCLLFSVPVSGVAGSAAQIEPDGFFEIRGGVLAHDVDNLWSHTRKEGGVDINAEAIFGRPRFPFLSGLVRANLGGSIHSRGETSKLYAGLLWEHQSRWGLLLDLGFGLAVHTGELESDNVHRKWLGSRVLFRVAVEAGYALSETHRISILFDHISNANLKMPNEGMDTLGVRYGYRF
jgi:hypothetical protein